MSRAPPASCNNAGVTVGSVSSNSLWQLARAMASCAAWSGERLRLGERVGLEQQEEAITESVLLELGQQAGHRIAVLTRPVESVIGADWLWWIQDYDLSGERWLGMLVQAKRLHVVDSAASARRPHYRLGQRRSPRSARQIDDLLSSSRLLGVPAVYALYNSASYAGSVSRTCNLGRLGPQPTDGITLLHAAAANMVVRTLKPSMDKVALQNVAGKSLPWSCVLTCVCDEKHDHYWNTDDITLGHLQAGLGGLLAQAGVTGPEADQQNELLHTAIRDRLSEEAQSVEDLPDSVRGVVVIRAAG